MRWQKTNAVTHDLGVPSIRLREAALRLPGASPAGCRAFGRSACRVNNRNGKRRACPTNDKRNGNRRGRPTTELASDARRRLPRGKFVGQARRLPRAKTASDAHPYKRRTKWQRARSPDNGIGKRCACPTQFAGSNVRALWGIRRGFRVWLKWDQSVIYFVTICVERRRHVLANNVAFIAFKNAAARLRDWKVLAAVIMPDHLHVIVTPTIGKQSWEIFPRR